MMTQVKRSCSAPVSAKAALPVSTGARASGAVDNEVDVPEVPRLCGLKGVRIGRGTRQPRVPEATPRPVHAEPQLVHVALLNSARSTIVRLSVLCISRSRWFLHPQQ